MLKDTEEPYQNYGRQISLHLPCCKEKHPEDKGSSYITAGLLMYLGNCKAFHMNSDKNVKESGQVFWYCLSVEIP